MKTCSCPLNLALGLLAAIACAVADDWPTYRHDNARSGVTAEKLGLPLAETWVFKSRHAPAPAWEAPRGVPVEGFLELPRARFDDAFHTVSVGDAVYFGSSADNKVYCLDAASGRARWTFFTGGPVRLAPTVADGRVYVGSDDGFVCCLGAKDGRVVWQRRAGLNDRQLPGHGKMISMWPIRTGVLVDEGTAYYGAGLFPSEGVYVESVRAGDGQALWRNDTGGESAEPRMSPQGYLLATATNLFVPQGRVSPMAFDRADGKRIHEAFFGKNIGGASAQIAADTLYSGTEEILGCDAATKRRVSWFNGRNVIITSETAYVTTTDELLAFSRQDHAEASLVQLNIRGQREKLNSAAAVPKKEKARLAAAIRLTREKLDELSKKLEALPVGDPKRAALENERAGAEATLKEDEAKIESIELKLADVQRRIEALKPKFDEVENSINQSVKWRVPSRCADALILAGGVLFAGGKGEVVAVHANTGEQLWTARASGTVKGLAVANGRLFVSTDTGAIHCFTPGKATTPARVVTGTARAAFPQDRLGAAYAAAADAIVRESGVKRGFCLVLGCPTGRLAMELAKRTSLKFICIEPDAQKVAAARKALDAAGLYGARVTVDHGPLDHLPYASYFANLIVSESAVLGWLPPTPAKEVLRVLKPCGGITIIGQPSEARAAAPALEQAKVREWLQGTELQIAATHESRGQWAKATRGPLPGAGAWTHEYGNPANTTCSDDKFVKCPLGLLWFGDPGPLQMVSRHRRAVSPLAVNGVLFVQGEDAVNAYDAYNGVKLWDRKMPGVVRTSASSESSNLAADRESFFVVSGNKCLRLEAATGAVRATFAVPQAADGSGRLWGHISVTDGILLGTASKTDNISDAMFACDIASGKLLWTRTNDVIQNSAISIADRRVYYADTGAKTEPPAEAAPAAKAPAKKPKKKAAASPRTAAKPNPVRNVIALDLKTGRQVWNQTYDISGCIGGSYFGTLGSMAQDGVLVLFGVFTDGHYWEEFFAKQFESRRIVALNARSGESLWAKNIAYRVRPLIVGDTLHAEPWAFKLKSGEPVTRVNPITGREEAWQFSRPGHHCGAPAAAPNVMAFRSYYPGYYDLVKDSGTVTFGGQRPGCWINFIFGNGLLTMPEASSGCMCPFPNTCTVAFAPRDEDRTWAKYSLSGETKPVKRLALNLGGPGDRRDADGKLWLGYPRPTGSLVLPIEAKVELPRGGGGYFAHSADSVRIEGTRDAWLYTFGCKDVRAIELPLLDAGDGIGRYTVRLGFAELEDAKPGERVFDIALQKKTALKAFDVVKEAGGPRKVIVKEFKGVDVDDGLLIEFKPPAKQAGGKLPPILQTVEVLRERMLSVGVAAPSFILSDRKSEQTAELRVSNQTDAEFAGTLRVTAPDGFAVTPTETPVKLTVGQRMRVALKTAVAKPGLPSRYPAKVRLLRGDGSVEVEKTADIDYLGRGGRVALKAAEDAHVIHVSPTMNYGNAAVLLVDGGSHVMGDDHHQIAYMKFQLAIPGKPTSARLRLYNAGNESTDGGKVCVVTGSWSESEITYANHPKLGEEAGRVGPIKSKEVRDLPLKLSLDGLKEISLAIEPANCDGVNYLSRESGKPAELVVEYEQE